MIKLKALLFVPFISFSALADEDLAEKHAMNFASLVQEYCVSFREKPNKLEEKLLQDGFRKHEDYEQTYVKYFSSVDYAVTLDKEVCTTDVLLKPADSMLFTLDQINMSLVTGLSIKNRSSEIDYELSIDGKRTKVANRSYSDGSGNKYSLTFPLENFTAFYMTFDVYWNR
jgi:hypothetical protein